MADPLCEYANGVGVGRPRVRGFEKGPQTHLTILEKVRFSSQNETKLWLLSIFSNAWKSNLAFVVYEEEFTFCTLCKFHLTHHKHLFG